MTTNSPAGTDQFWSLIDSARAQSGSDLSGFCDALRELLDTYSAQEIAAFDHQLSIQMARSYTWPLWGAAYVIGGGCSDDSFDYFRAWLIAQGRTVFEQALESPDQIADLPLVLHDGDTELESLLYVAAKLYEDRIGEYPPATPLDPALSGGPKGAEWSEDDLDTLFPQLSAKYG